MPAVEFKELVYHELCVDAPRVSFSHPASTIGQLRFVIVPAVSGWGIDGAPTDMRTVLALSLGLRPFVFAAYLGRECRPASAAYPSLEIFASIVDGTFRIPATESVIPAGGYFALGLKC
jgi:hypothetical protein